MRIIYINENEDLYSQLIKSGVNVIDIAEQVDFISKKKNNNKIGYFQFRVEKEYIKICILPKVIDIAEDKEKVDIQFLKYLSNCYDVMSYYRKEQYLYNKIKKNYRDILKFNSNFTEKNICIDLILCSKYNYILNYMIKKIKKLYLNQQELRNYRDKNIRGKIELRKSILELNKSIIHQSRKELNYSDNTINMLHFYVKYFLKNRTEAIESEEERVKIIKKANKVLTLIESKFSIKRERYNIELLVKEETMDMFKQKKILDLHSCIVCLLDCEGYFAGEENDSRKKTEQVISICFDPALIYEYIVYKQLNIQKKEKEEIQFKGGNKDKSKYISYFAYNNSERVESLDIKATNPDFVIYESEKPKNVIDAKWKVLNKPNEILEVDIDKLKRDCTANNTNEGILVYPKINFDYKGFMWQCNTEIDGKNFQVRIDEISIDNI